MNFNGGTSPEKSQSGSDLSYANSSETELKASGTFTGQWLDVLDKTEVSILVVTDQAGTLYYDLSTDGKTLHKTKVFEVGTSGAIHTLVLISKYIRIRYTNGLVDQGTFKLQVLTSYNKNLHLASTLDEKIGTYTDVQNVRSVLVGEGPDTVYRNVKLDQFGAIDMNLGKKNTTAFGEVAIAAHDPILQELFTYSINPRVWVTTNVNTGTATQANATAVLSTGTTTASSSTIESKKRVQYRPGMGVLCRFTSVFDTPVADTLQLVGVGDAEDGFFITYNGLTFSILHRNSASGSLVDTYIPQSSFNIDKLDGNDFLPVIDFEKGNVWQIAFQYLGFGQITFKVENPLSGELITFHTIDYANGSIYPSLKSPSLPFCMMVDNLTTTSDITLKASSCALFIEGSSQRHGFSNSKSNSLSGIGSTELPILTLQNRTTYNGKTNKNTIYPTVLNIATISGTKPSTINITLNATLTAPSYININLTESIAATDIAATAISNGDVLTSTVMGKEDTQSIDLSVFDIFLDPGEILTISASTTSGSVEVFTSLSWREDV